MVFHLPGQVLARAGISQIQAVFIDQHGLMLEPGGPCFFAHALPDTLAEFAGIGRSVQSFRFSTDVDDIYSACQLMPSLPLYKGRN